MNYQQQAIAGMNPVELIVALYDGMMQFLYRAIGAIDAGNARARRIAVGRVLAILMHLQSRLRMDIGGNSAKALSEFYASIFALCLEGSRLESPERLREAIGCIRDVRDAWNIAAHDPEVLQLLNSENGASPALMRIGPASVAEPAGAGWTA
ncbi:MAG TPA: flagellar export chaperone FliS [Acidobacteriaceae bacterium]|jgi:flagellar secretion chaperone FliS|nr:flagellar export chaperone FliS [Acidobacteriaceae bacterium]